jgi:cytochrome P450 family 2 subfamily D
LADKVFPGKKTFLTIMDKLVTEHKKIWDLYQPSCDLTGAFLAEMEKMRLWDLVSIVL